MADRKPVDSSNRIYPRCNHDAVMEEKTGMREEVGKQQGKPGFGERARPENRFFDDMPGGYGMYQRLPVPGDDAATSRFQQQVVVANARNEEGGLFTNLLANISAAERHRLSRPLEGLPEDALGELHRPVAINLNGCMDALRNSQ